MAHDFNNLLTVIIGALDVLERNPDDDKRRERMLQAAQGAAWRGEKLTQHLLAFARRQPLNPEMCRIDTMIAESEGLLRRAVGEGVELSLDLKAGGRTALTDSGQFEAALLNLVVNARDATPPGGAINVSSQGLDLEAPRGDLPAGRYLRVAVADTGAGMDAETLQRAFEPFYTTKPTGKGTGLGLSQVYGFVRQSGAAVTIESTIGQGTTVAMLLPVREAFSPVEVLAVRPPATPRQRARAAGRGRRRGGRPDRGDDRRAGPHGQPGGQRRRGPGHRPRRPDPEPGDHRRDHAGRQERGRPGAWRWPRAARTAGPAQFRAATGQGN